MLNGDEYDDRRYEEQDVEDEGRDDVAGCFQCVLASQVYARNSTAMELKMRRLRFHLI